MLTKFLLFLSISCLLSGNIFLCEKSIKNNISSIKKSNLTPLLTKGRSSGQTGSANNRIKGIHDYDNHGEDNEETDIDEIDKISRPKPFNNIDNYPFPIASNPIPPKNHPDKLWKPPQDILF